MEQSIPVQEDPAHGAHYHRRYEIGRICKHLAGLFQLYAPHLIEQDRKDDGGRPEDQRDHIQPKRIPHNPREKRMCDKSLEMLQPDPFAPPDSQASTVVLERYLYAIDRNIMEDKNGYDRRQYHQVQYPVPPYLLQQFMPS